MIKVQFDARQLVMATQLLKEAEQCVIKYRRAHGCTVPLIDAIEAIKRAQKEVRYSVLDLKETFYERQEDEDNS
jgi:hypothetical protein